jgi:hypothetical protein
MGMHDELFCQALLPDTAVPEGATFETKAFPWPFLYRYTITKAGRLIDVSGRDLELDGYLEFYHYDFNRSPDRIEYRAHFCRGQLENIVRVQEEPDGADRVIYGLAAYRHFAIAAPSSFMSETSEDDLKKLEELFGNQPSAADASVPRPAEEQEWLDSPAVGRELL